MPIGKTVRYCGHKATFQADIFEVAGAVVVRAPAAITPNDEHGVLNRDPKAYDLASHHLEDFPHGGFWRPDLGVFVVPKAQCSEVIPPGKFKKGQRR